MTTITKEQAQKIIDAADDVISALAGTNDDIRPESGAMVHAWDYLNDVAAPPAVVRELARIALASMDADPDYIRYDCGCCGFETIEDWRDNDTRPKCNHKPMAKTELFTAPTSPVVPTEIRNGIKAEAMAELLKYAHDYAPLTAKQWGTLVNNWHQTFVGLSGDGDACRAAMLKISGGKNV